MPESPKFQGKPPFSGALAVSFMEGSVWTCFWDVFGPSPIVPHWFGVHLRDTFGPQLSDDLMRAIEEEFFGGKTTTTGYRVYGYVRVTGTILGERGHPALYHRYTVILCSCYEVMKLDTTKKGSLFWVICFLVWVVLGGSSQLVSS